MDASQTAMMTTAAKKIWRGLGSIHLTVILLLTMMIDLTSGYFHLKTHAHLFHPLNDIGFIQWTQTYGKMNLSQTLWLFILIGLLACLALNTFVCTTNRVVILCRNRKTKAHRRRFILRLAPHFMHYAVLVMLSGYLFSYLLSTTHVTNILIPGSGMTIPGTDYRVQLNHLDIDYYSGTRLDYMHDYALGTTAELTLYKNGRTRTARLGVNQPVWLYPYSIHLKNFSPKKRNKRKQFYINIIIKKDPGMKFYFAGMLMFVAGLFVYLYDWFTQHLAGSRRKQS